MTKKPTKPKKLQLARKSVAVLDKDQLKAVQGGTDGEADTDACAYDRETRGDCVEMNSIPNCRFTRTR